MKMPSLTVQVSSLELFPSKNTRVIFWQMMSTVEPGKLYYKTGRAMLENNPLPYDVKLWMPGTYLWLADRIDSPY